MTLLNLLRFQILVVLEVVLEDPVYLAVTVTRDQFQSLLFWKSSWKSDIDPGQLLFPGFQSLLFWKSSWK